MNVTNVVYAVFGSMKHTVTEPLHQWDKGQVLKFKNLSGLPEYYEVHFSNERVGGVAKVFTGDSDGVSGWDEYLTSGQSVYAWLYLSAGSDDGKTMRSVEIPVIKRSRPSDISPTPQEQSQVDILINSLNSGVSRAESAAETAEQSAENASVSETNAKTSEDNALLSEQHAKTSEDNAKLSEDNAAESERQARISAQEAKISENNAEHYAHLAEQGAASAGYLDVEINEDGHLIYIRTDQVDVDFSLENGHLIMEAV